MKKYVSFVALMLSLSMFICGCPMKPCDDMGGNKGKFETSEPVPPSPGEVAPEKNAEQKQDQSQMQSQSQFQSQKQEAPAKAPAKEF